MLARAYRLFLVTSFGVGGSVVNFFAQALIAARFGAGKAVDAYIFSLSAPSFIAGLLAASASYILVPEMARVAHDPIRNDALSSRLLKPFCMLALAMILCGLPAVLLQPALLLPSPSEIEHQAELNLLISLAWVTGGVQVFNALLLSRLNAIGRQVAAAMLSLPPGLFSIALLLPAKVKGIWIVPIGTLLGTITVTWIAYSIQRSAFKWKAYELLDREKAIVIPRAAWLSVIALSCFSSYAIIDSYWAPRAGIGVLSTLGYAQRILIGAGSFVAIGPSVIAVPFLSRIANDGDVKRFRVVMVKILLCVTALTSCIAISIATFSGPIVSLLFERGAFSKTAADQVAAALSHLAPGMVPMIAGVMLMRAIFCIPQSFGWAAGIGLCWSALYFAFSGILADNHAIGLADAYSLAWALTAVAASVILWRRSALLAR